MTASFEPVCPKPAASVDSTVESPRDQRRRPPSDDPSCLLNDNRNPDWTRAEVETTLWTLLGVRAVHWIHGTDLVRDDIDSHVDNLVRFGLNCPLLLAAENDPSDVNYAPLTILREQVEPMAAEQNRSLVLLPVLVPVVLDATRFLTSNTNFYAGGSAVLVPHSTTRRTPRRAPCSATCFRTGRWSGSARRRLLGLGTFH